MEDLKRQFETHLTSIGFELNAPREVILGKLKARMGEKRFAEMVATIQASHSASNQEHIYTLFQDLIEGNLMRSLDPGATLEASFHLYRQGLRHMISGVRVIELGCWTGGLASFIAAKHPRCAVVGVDFEQKIVDACTNFYRLPNLSFIRWNYRRAKPEELDPADVLLCSMGVVHHLPDNSSLPDPAAVRRSREYVIQRDHAIGYFSLWRSAAKADAMMLAVLRLRLFPRFLAWMDAAQQCGWTAVLDRLWHVDMPAEPNPLPGFVFKAKQSAPLSEEDVLDRWAWFNCRGHIYARLKGGAALTAYRRLHAKAKLATREYRRGGLLTQDEVGVNEEVGYVFTHDASCEYRLLLISHSKAKELAAAISTVDSCTPLLDDGVFETGSAPARDVPPAKPTSSPFFAGASPFACAIDD